MRSLVTMGLKDAMNQMASMIQERSKKTKVKLNNSSPIITDDLMTMLKEVADMLGIEFGLTGYTYDLEFKPDSNNELESLIYGPDVSNFAGEVCINWGKQHQPLFNVPETTALNFVNKEKLVMLNVSLDQYGDDAVTLPLKLKDFKGDASTHAAKLNKLLKAKSAELVEYFNVAFGKVKLVELPLKEKLEIVNAYYEDICGDSKLVLVIKNHGAVVANTAIVDSDYAKKEKLPGMYLKCLGHYKCRNKHTGVSVALIPADAPDVKVSAEMLMAYE